MNLQEMLDYIHQKLKEACFTDIMDETGVSSAAVRRWRDNVPEKPSLHVFCKLARYCGLNPSIDQLEELF